MKFILNERFILTEAEDINALKTSTLKAIEDNFGDTLLQKVNSDIEKNNAFTRIDKAADEVNKIFNSDKKDLAVYKGPINNYTNAVRTEVNNTDGTGAGDVLNATPDLERKLQELDDLVDQKLTDADDISEAIQTIKSKFNTLHSIILKAESGENNTDARTLSSNIDKFKKTRAELEQAIKNTIAKDDTAITAFKTFSKNIANEKVSLAAIQDLNNNDFITEASKRLVKAIDLFIKLDNLLANYSTTENPEEVNSRSTDWGERFKRVTNEKESVALWDEYFKTVWGNNAAKVRDLGKAFIQELLKAGFTEYTNPFIAFVKNNIDKLNLNADTYPAIHNAYISEYIDDDALKNKTTNNILYNENLYFKSAREIFEYLKIQSDASTQAPSEITRQTYGAWSDTPNKLGLAIFDDKVSIEDIERQKAAKSADITGELSNIKLKSISNVRAALSLLELTSSEIVRKLPATDADVDRIYNKFKDKNKICQVLLWLNTQYPESNLKALVLDKITDLPTKNLDATNNKLLNEIKDQIKTLSFKNLPDFMLKLAKKAGFTIKE